MVDAGVWMESGNCTSTTDSENGDIVIALIGDEATIKSFYKEKGYIRFNP